MKRFSTSAVIANVSFNIYLTRTMQICTWLGNKVLSATLFFFFFSLLPIREVKLKKNVIKIKLFKNVIVSVGHQSGLKAGLLFFCNSQASPTASLFGIVLLK